jgi:hypothetical protein
MRVAIALGILIMMSLASARAERSGVLKVKNVDQGDDVNGVRTTADLYCPQTAPCQVQSTVVDLLIGLCAVYATHPCPE